MEETITNQEAGDEKGTTKKVVPTGVPYPVEPLAVSLDTVSKLVAENGTGVVITKEDISRVTGRKQATLVLWFSTYQQYGILEKVHGKGFLPTALYNKYRDKVYDHHERECLLEMFKNPPLYNKIIDNLNETNLPSEERFPSLLKNEPYNVNINSSDRAAKVFFENARFLKVLDSNNKLVFKQPKHTDTSENKSEQHRPKLPVAVHENDEDNLFTLPIPLDTKRKAYIKYPLNDLKKKDIKVIVKALSFIASSIMDDEQDFEIKIFETKKE